MLEELTTWTRLLTAVGATLHAVGRTALQRQSTARVHSPDVADHDATGQDSRRHPDVGSVTAEAVILIALMVAAAITIVGIIVAKVTARANSIQM